MKKLMLILVLVLFASTCFAEKYQFQDSAENEDAPKIFMCKDFLANLKALGEPPMVCDRKFHAKFKQFTWPKWTKLDAWENRDFIFQIWEEYFKQAFDESYPYAKDLQHALENHKINLKEYISRGDITLAVTRLEIDGKLTDVLQFMEAKNSFPCTDKGFFSSRSFGRQHYIIDMSNRKVDFKATGASLLFGIHGNPNEHYGDMFLYKGIPYAAFWYGNSESGMLVVKGGYYDYCFIEYNKTK